jgi:hypothetical protein
MEQHVNSYQGLSQDGAFDTIGATLYIDAQDVRITTTDGESQGAITNIQGNEEAFSIPQSPTDDGAATTIGPREIIGVCTIRNRIILFCADNSGINGWIYYVEYNEKTRTITVPPTLIYNGDGNPQLLRFSKDNPIEAIGRYESDCVQRIYWTDYNEPIKSLKIESFSSLPVTDSVETLSIFPNITYTQPITTAIQIGGSLLTGEYQFAYRLITADGKQTLISPPGNLIHIVSASESLSSTASYMGDPKDTNTNKSIQITLDTTNYVGIYERVEFIAVFYSDLSVSPEISSIETVLIGGNSTSVLYTGDEETITPITPIEFAIKVYPFSTVKTMVPKDNSLVVANIKSTSFDVNDLLSPGETLDLQTFRYNSSQDKPSTSGVDDPVTSSPYTTNDDKFNLPYNSDAHWDGDWHTERQFKYQDNGTTLGGTGANISYKFVIRTGAIDSSTAPAVARLANTATQVIDLGDGYTHENPSFQSAASPFISGLKRGYKRGDTYRFGIVFYNKKGESSFVEYIGDIKFPDISETTDSATIVQGSDYNFSSFPAGIQHFPTSIDADPGGTSAISHDTVGCNLGLEFTLDFTSCPGLLDNITSFQIVRVKRENTDKRRLSSGQIRVFRRILNPGTANDYDFESPDGTPGGTPVAPVPLTLGHRWFFGNTGSGTNEDDGYCWNGAWNFLNDEITDFYAYPSTSGGRYIWGDYTAFYSPEISYEYNNDVTDKSLGYLITGAYDRFQMSDNSTPLSVNYDQKIPSSGFHNPGSLATPAYGEILEYHRTIRNVRPIDLTSKGDYDGVTNPIPYRGIEYYRNSFENTATLMDQSSANDGGGSATDIETNQEQGLKNIMKLYGPFSNQFGTAVAVRNVRISLYEDDPAGSLENEPNEGDSTKLSRGGTALFSVLERPTIDPVTGGAIPLLASSIPFAVWKNDPTTPTAWDYVRPEGALFITAFGAPDVDPGLNWEVYNHTPVVDLIQHKSEIYGGYSDDALEKNTFFPCSPVITLTGVTPSAFQAFGGDTFISMFTVQEGTTVLNKLFYSDTNANERWKHNDKMTTSFPVETQVNVDLAYGATLKTGVKAYVIVGGVAYFQSYLSQEIQNASLIDNPSGVYKERNMYKGAYNTIYSEEPNASGLGFFIKPGTLADCGKNDIRAYLSDVKINEEELDSWTIFRSNNYYDVEANHGPINKIVNWNDEVYFFQDTGVGAYSINPRAVTTTDDGQPTELGSAQGFAHHKYISTEQGSIHQWGIQTTDTGIYYFDATHKKIFRIGGGEQGNQPLSESKGMHSFLAPLNGDLFLRKENGGDNPLKFKGITTAKDMINDEVLFSFHGLYNVRTLVGIVSTTYYPGDYVATVPDEGGNNRIYLITSEVTTNNEADIIANGQLITDETLLNDLRINRKTLVFDELADSFSSFYSAVPQLYIQNGNILMSPNPGNEGLNQTVFTHNKGNYGEFYGTVTESFVKLVINPSADINKILRFIEFNSTVRSANKDVDRDVTITHFRVQTQYQDTTKVAYSASNVKRRFDKWRVKIPRDQLSASRRGRLRSTFFILTLYYDNTYNKELILNRIMSHYDIQVY